MWKANQTAQHALYRTAWWSQSERLWMGPLTHWGPVTHICVFNLTIISSDNGLSPGRRQAIIRANAGILLIGPLGINFSGILFGIQAFSFKKMHVKMSSAKWRPFCLGLNVLNLLCARWLVTHEHRPACSRKISKPIDQALTLINPFLKEISTSFLYYNKWFWFMRNQIMSLYHFTNPIE